MFNREIEKGEEAEDCLSGMRKYFQINNYSDKLKANVATYNLTWKANIWCQDIKKVRTLENIM